MDTFYESDCQGDTSFPLIAGHFSPGQSAPPAAGARSGARGSAAQAAFASFLAFRSRSDGTSASRSFARRRDRVDVYFDDGSMDSLVEGSLEAEKLLPAARDALAATRR